MSDSTVSEGASPNAMLVATLAPYWPDLFGRLGVRAADYVEAASRKAEIHRIVDAAAVARYVNMCCALGPNFEDKPENEWALAVLSDDRLGEWLRLHQLVVRSTAELGRRSVDGRYLSAQLLRGDGAVMDAFDAARLGDDADAELLPRLACDTEAVDIRLLEIQWRMEYRLTNGEWRLAPVPEFASSFRMGPGRPAPPMICVLTHAPRQGPPVRLQTRVLNHAQCSQDRHPLITHTGSHGIYQWRGHAAQAVSWHVFALPTPFDASRLGVSLMDEVVPDTSLLRSANCELRDEGIPTGSLQTCVWAYPADQWLFVLQRDQDPSLQWPRPADAALPLVVSLPRCRYERDGVAMPATAWAKGFQESLQKELLAGLDKLFAAWQRTTQNSSMQASISILTGSAALTWGWREGPEGIAGRPVLRCLGDFDLRNQLEIELLGEIELGITRTKVRLFLRSDAPMKHRVVRETALPVLFEVLLPTVTRWQTTVALEFEPIVAEDAAVWSQVGPCKGLLQGEVGLRPRASGGGWNWYARIATDTVSVALTVHDPLLGQTQKSLFLLPSIDLLDWSFG